jgi:urease accessory protein
MSLARLLQLASPALPVGAYSYSGGLEAAVEAGVVKDAASAERWIAGVLEHSIAAFDAPLLFSLLGSPGKEKALNDAYLASRETAELRAETLQMGYSLCRLLKDLGLEGVPEGEVAFPVAFAFAARAWGIAPADAVQAYLWGWAENQVMAGVKAVPLGQTEGQRMLLSLGSSLESLCMRAEGLGEEGPVNFAPALAILSAKHETQYSRLFRS